MRALSFFVLMILFFSCQKQDENLIRIALHDNWQVMQVGDSSAIDASVPGNIYSDLLAAGKIPDPFIGSNEEKVQWVADKAWKYETEFTVENNVLNQKYIELSFDGLDTYATVFLNDVEILQADNAFRSWSVDVKDLLKRKNKLQIVFQPVAEIETGKAESLNYKLPEGNRVFTRKAQFQYGWDWGPKLNTMGIWRDVTLQAWSKTKINFATIHQEELTDDKATLGASVECSYPAGKNISAELYINDELMTKTSVSEEASAFSLFCEIDNPKRWWPHNVGEPYLYDVKILMKQKNKVIDEWQGKKGLREIELVNEKDSLGESFYFKVNGEPIYMKGANYIPQNSMQNQVTDAHYDRLLSDVVDANMNMLRVWGGGIYENDLFYELCDEKGILVWQDFMYACAMYPGDEEFLTNAEKEAIDNVKRLSNYACVALWCGNNECSEGWNRWGWQNDRNEVEKNEIWTNYQNLFQDILPGVVEVYDSEKQYWESSPKYGRGNSSYEFEGDAHDWWVWHDAYPFEHFEDHVPRFMSEFGFQAYPSYQAVKMMNDSDTLALKTPAIATHQKHVRGFQLIDEYMQRDFPVPSNAKDYIYISQLLQAHGITKGIEAHRRAKPYNMGTLFWQLNDCWPVISWSSIDFLCNWKALHYKAKRSFANTLISFERDGNQLNTFIVNDHLVPQKETLQFRLIDFYGNQLWQSEQKIDLPANVSEQVHALDLLAYDFDWSKVMLTAKFGEAESNYYFVKPKELELLQAEIKQEITKEGDAFRIELSSDVLQKDVFLFTEEEGHFSDNFFDLLPGEPKVIQFSSKNGNVNLDLKIKTLNMN